MWKLASTLVFLVGLSLVEVGYGEESYSRHDFPAASRFVFGAGTSAYQVEGAADEDGRTPSIFDTLAHSGTSGANGDVACDQYHKYKEDVQLMVDTGLEAYRFSISWSRLIPNGRGPMNPKGLQYYNNLINELISHGIQPHVTLHHDDLPQALEDEYGGWISRKVVEDFTTFADVCFRMFGDRVRHWTTFNEANVFVLGGYDAGFLPPQRCSSPFGFVTCTKGNSTIEPYLAAHYILISHASAARLYKQKYQEKQKGYVGFNLFAYYFYPFTNTTEDIMATQRAYDFYVGCYDEQSARLFRVSGVAVGSARCYGTLQANLWKPSDLHSRKWSNDATERNARGLAKGESFASLYRCFTRQSKQFSITESIGVHFSNRNGSNMRGYFTWSFLDLYELLDGYNSGYGLYYVDLDDPDLKRYPKLSSQWYSHFLKGGNSNTFIMNSSSVSSS